MLAKPHLLKTFGEEMRDDYQQIDLYLAIK